MINEIRPTFPIYYLGRHRARYERRYSTASAARTAASTTIPAC